MGSRLPFWQVVALSWRCDETVVRGCAPLNLNKDMEAYRLKLAEGWKHLNFVMEECRWQVATSGVTWSSPSLSRSCKTSIGRT